jgi:hypothetical protein
MLFALLIGLGVLWALLDVSPVDLAELGAGMISDVAERGRQLTKSTVNAAGVVTDEPQALVDAASATLGRPVDPEAYALARMVRSEEGSAGQITKVYLANVAQNQARALGWSVWNLMLFHKAAERSGWFGRQISGRFATTADPFESDLAAAEWALSNPDQTGGATNFVDRRGFGVQEGTGSFQDFVQEMAAEGKVPGVLPSAPSKLVFFWRTRLPDEAEVLT